MCQLSYTVIQKENLRISINIFDRMKLLLDT